MRRQPNVRVLLDEVTGVDRAGKCVRMDDRAIPYDFLVIATGANQAYGGHDEWAAHAPGLKSIEEAIDIRHRILTAFERAEMAVDLAERRRLLTFGVIGGGPTGAEMARTLAELKRQALAAESRVIDQRQARVVLVEAGPRILPGFWDGLSDYAGRALENRGVEVLTGQPITRCDADGIALSDERLPAATVIWAAGIAVSPAARQLGIPGDRAGRVPVGHCQASRRCRLVHAAALLAPACAFRRICPGVSAETAHPVR